MRSRKTLRTEISDGSRGQARGWARRDLLPALLAALDDDEETEEEVEGEPEAKEEAACGLLLWSVALHRETMTLPESDSSSRRSWDEWSRGMSLDRMKACLRW
jgi:hypothetical protein